MKIVLTHYEISFYKNRYITYSYTSPKYQGHKKLALILLKLNEEAKRKFICRNKAFNYVVSLAPIILLYFPAHKLLHGI